MLGKMLKECVAMHMDVSSGVLRNIVSKFEIEIPSFKECREAMASWYSCFNAELASQSMWIVLPHRNQFILTSDQRGLGLLLVNAVKPFRDAFYDANEAGHCFAFERFTACVFHLMRCAEFGLG